MASADVEPRINDQIRAGEVRLVDEDGQQIGIRRIDEALDMARDAGLDLVEVAEKATPPVCRIMDYGKYKYENAQQAKQSRKNSTNVVVKEMKYRPKIGRGDFQTKTRKVRSFLVDGHKVKVTIMFRGREVQHPQLGRRILDDVAAEMEDVATVEVYPRLDGRNMVMVLGPGKRSGRKRQRRPQGEPQQGQTDQNHAEQPQQDQTEQDQQPQPGQATQDQPEQDQSELEQAQP